MAETVVMFPFMAQGHMTPYLALALQIEQRFGYKIIFINTPLNIKKLHSALPSNSTISLTPLPFSSSDHGLPPDTENTDSLPYPLIIKLFEASLTLKGSFNKIISDLPKPPLCIITDMFLGWTVEIAKELNIFHACFNTCGAYGAGVYYSMWMHLPHSKTDSDVFTLPDFPEAGFLHRTQLPWMLQIADGTDPWSKFLQKVLPYWFESDAYLLNTVEEFEQTGMEYFKRKMNGRSVWGVLPAFVCSVRPQKKSGVDLDTCMEWLNKRDPNSVLFVSFGSQNSISSTQMMELAIGLEESSKSFIWVIRPPIGNDLTGDFKAKWLPEGYEDRITGHNRGLIVHKWAPQLEILAHKSTCAFLTHCGWNSVIESLSNGVPLLGWPLGGEQFYNAKFLEDEVGVCAEVGRGISCEIKHENVKKVVDLVMGESDKGVAMRKKATEIKEIIEDGIREEEGCRGSCLQAIEEFVKTALSKKK